MTEGGAGETERPTSPLAVPVFRAILLAATFSFMGSFVQDIAERWVILELTGSPLPAAMLGTAFVTASMLGMIPAGILADRRDRRGLVVLSQIVQACGAGTIALLAWHDSLSPHVLLMGAAAIGLGMSIGSPAWSAMVPDIMPRELVAEAIALQAVAFNLARAVGPAIGGLVLSTFGATACFALNAVSFVLVIIAVATAKLPKKTYTEAHPAIAQAFAQPLRFATRDAGVRSAIVAMLVFTAGASLVYGLAPAYGKQTLGATASQYGLMFGAMGFGAIVGTRILRRLRPRIAPRVLVALTTLTYAVSALAMSRVHSIAVATVLFLPAGAGWTGTFSSLSALVQLWTPDRLRARTIALYTVIHFGTWAIGSTVGGLVAERWDVRTAMLVGSLLCGAGGLLMTRLALPDSFNGPTVA